MTKLIGQRFNLVGHNVSIELSAVERPEQLDPRFDMYSLVFEGPTDAELWQDTWELEYMGDTVSVFLVPIGPRSSGRLGYESVQSPPAR